MARAYHQKKLSTKLSEGAIAGLIGGVAAAIVLMVIDTLTQTGNSPWHTLSVFGSLLVGGSPGGSVDTGLPGAAFVAGLAALLILFVLIGVGLTFYVPIIRRLGWSTILLGAVYGIIIWLLVPFFLLNFMDPSLSGKVSNLSLFVVAVLGCAATGWLLEVIEARAQQSSQSS